MSFEIGIGFSQDLNMESAAQKAAIQARKALKGKKPVIAFIFSSIHYDPEIFLPVIRLSFAEAKLIGCSTAGVILADSIETRGIGILTLAGAELKVGIASIDNLTSGTIERNGVNLAQKTLQNLGPHQRQIFISFSAGHVENNSLLLRGIQSILGHIFPIVGAGSSDDFHFKKTFQIFEDTAMTNGACSVMFGEPHLKVSVASRHGWLAIGRPRLVDRSTENIIHLIDGEKAVRLYHEFLGNEIQGVLNRSDFGKTALLYPLGILDEDTGEYLLRNPVEILPNGSIVCQGNVPQGSKVHIMLGDIERAKIAAEKAVQEAIKGLLGKSPKLIIVIESMARLKLFGRNAYQEIEAIRNICGRDTPIFGFYSDGEICPSETEEGIKGTHLQNQSIVIIALG